MLTIDANLYSEKWFKIFLEPISHTQTQAEVEFISRNLPNPPYSKLLDLCCGQGRHSKALAEVGYCVTAIDLHEDAIVKAKELSKGNVQYLQMDMRDIGLLPDSFDAIISMWQSFGYFTEAQNTKLLEQVSQKLNPNGRFILDIYDRLFFRQHQGTMKFERAGHKVTERKSMTSNRLTVRLDYGAKGEGDVFQWQLYTPDEITDLAESVGLRLLVSCTGFNESKPVSPDAPRMQLVFEKTDGDS